MCSEVENVDDPQNWLIYARSVAQRLLTFSFGKHARTTCISLFPGQTAARSFLHFPSSALFFSRVLPTSKLPFRESSRAATSTWPKRIFRDRTRQHLACFARCPPKVQSSRGRRNNLTFSFGKHARTTCISLFPGQTATRSFLFPSAPCRLFLLRAARLQAASSREILHMRAGQCGNQMGTEF